MFFLSFFFIYIPFRERIIYDFSLSFLYVVLDVYVWSIIVHVYRNAVLRRVWATESTRQERRHNSLLFEHIFQALHLFSLFTFNWAEPTEPTSKRMYIGEILYNAHNKYIHTPNQEQWNKNAPRTVPSFYGLIWFSFFFVFLFGTQAFNTLTTHTLLIVSERHLKIIL